MMPFFILNLFNADAFVFVTYGVPVTSICVGGGELGGISELEDGDQILTTIVFRHK